MKKIFLIFILIPFFTGCAMIDKALTNDPPPRVDPVTGEMIDPPPTLKPGVKGAIQLIADLAPVPWSSLAGNGILSALTAFYAFRGRKWKKATISSVQSANEFRQIVKLAAPDRYQEVKNRIIGNQNMDGTRKLIKGGLNSLS